MRCEHGPNLLAPAPHAHLAAAAARTPPRGGHAPVSRRRATATGPAPRHARELASAMRARAWLDA